MNKPLILSLGSINKDIQVRTERWPEPGETLMVKDLLTTGGGKAANRAFLTSKLGAPSLLLGRLGEDEEATEVLKSLEQAGVNLEHVRRMPGQRTGLAMVVVHPDGNKGILLAANANESWEQEGPAEVSRIISQAPAGSVLAIDLEVPEAVVHKALEAAQEKNFRIVLDPSPSNKFKDVYYSMADFITPNQSEAQALLGFQIKSTDDAFRACEEMLKKGVRHALVKMGSQGYVMITNKQQVYLPAPEVKMLDTTGAGDAFAGALSYAIWDKQETIDAFRFAAAASSLAVTGYGSQQSYPDKKTIEKLMAVMNNEK